MTEQRIDESLARLSRPRVRLSIEDRVMAGVRREAALQRERAEVTTKKKVLLGGVAAAGVVAEALLAAAVLAVVVPVGTVLAPVLGRPVGAAYGILHPLLDLFVVAMRAASVVGEALAVTISGLALFAPSPSMLAALFMTMVSTLTFFAVRRDLKRSPATVRGLR
jgi:hypothetical protein